jgi:methylenetetrahydrofolate dehydrogenase (NADP+)/methenyltetrahydrofolate cyclohydrolase
MKVQGKPLSEVILLSLADQIKQEKLYPHLAIILAGGAASSLMYIKFKQIAAERIGIKTTLLQFSESTLNECKKTIDSLNNDPDTHGVIVQLPVYPSWPTEELVNSVSLEKDVDGFLEKSPFDPATAEAVWEMLKEFARLEEFEDVNQFLKNKKIVVLGKGKTAGKPVRDLLQKNGFTSELIDSKTENPDLIISNADVIISATGKKHIINADNIKIGAYVIGVGVGKENIDGQDVSFGDIDEDQIKDIAKLYCPTIGGIGPLTVACLLRNVVKSAAAN